MSGARSGALLGAASGVSIVGAYVFLLAAGRILGSEDYGSLAALLGLLAVVLIPAGALQMAVSREISRHVASGDSLFIPRGVVHGFTNEGDVDSRVLCAISPGLLGPAYFEEVAAVLAVGGPPDVAKIGEVMRRHGLTPVPPAA